MVGRTEVLEPKREGADVEGVELPASDSLRNKVSYMIGALADSKERAAAEACLSCLPTQAVQDAYANFAFVRAAAEKLKPRPIP
jgi:hypothetical protein